MKKNNILFLNLATFHFTGGIEKVNRCIYKALDDTAKERTEFDYRAISFYDGASEFQSRYANPKKVFNFKQNKFKASLFALFLSFFSNTILLSHINLGPIAFLIKSLMPSKKLIIIAHGIEIWDGLPGFKLKALEKADKIIAVSNYTKSRVLEAYQIPEERVVVCNNGLDPFIEAPTNFDKPQYLQDRYGFTNDHFILYTLTRLSSAEKYKGYDMVIEAIAALITDHPHLRYMIGGKADPDELHRVQQLIQKHGLQNHVKLLGFVKEEEMASHFLLADTYIMPSKGEGFGIVFIEAAFYGLPVIAGNQDGSVDALLNGQSGQLVQPEILKEVKSAISHQITNKIDHSWQSQLASKAFEFSHYKKNFIQHLAA